MANPTSPRTNSSHETSQTSNVSESRPKEILIHEDSQAVALTGRYVLKDAPEILRDTVTLALALLSIWMISKLLLKYLLGSDATFFDWIPIRYAFDAAHLAMLITFFTRLFRRNKQ